MALEEATRAIARDKAAVQVELKLTQEQLEQARISLREFPAQQLQNASIAVQGDEAKFNTIHSRNKVLCFSFYSKQHSDVALPVVLYYNKTGFASSSWQTSSS